MPIIDRSTDAGSPTARALPLRPALLLLLLVAGLLLYRLHTPPLIGPDEPRYARVAVEMYRSGDHITPTLQGQPWFEKPPLYYWLASLAFVLFGEGETAARLPSVLAGVLWTFSVALVGARLYGTKAGLHAGFILGTSVLSFAFGRVATMDLLLASTMTVGVGLIALRFLGNAGPGAVTASAVALGLAVLAKGPIGLVLPALILVTFYLLARWLAPERLPKLRGLPWRFVGVFALVTLPWYLAMCSIHGSVFIDVFLVGHNLLRFFTTIHRHPGPFFYYLPILLIGLFPWSGLLVPGLAALRPRRTPIDLFLLAWLLAPLAFFSVAASKLPGYFLPCLAPLALLLGRAAAMGGDVSVRLRRLTAFATLATGAAFACLPIALRLIDQPLWHLTLAPGAWALVMSVGFGILYRFRAAEALSLLRVGAAVFLLLCVHAFAPVIASRESARDLILPARGREIVIWGAKRSLWMAAYFYNEARLQPVDSLAELRARARDQPTLVLCGPVERSVLDTDRTLRLTELASGPRRNTLVKVERR
jgi:4-amino-4-deoxy-L-arabinose transferase-like glycosyltransferase